MSVRMIERIKGSLLKNLNWADQKIGSLVATKLISQHTFLICSNVSGVCNLNLVQLCAKKSTEENHPGSPGNKLQPRQQTIDEELKLIAKIVILELWRCYSAKKWKQKMELSKKMWVLLTDEQAVTFRTTRSRTDDLLYLQECQPNNNKKRCS